MPLQQPPHFFLGHRWSLGFVVAGPFTDKTEQRGLLIFRASSPDEVRAMGEEDPLVKSGVTAGGDAGIAPVMGGRGFAHQ